MEKKFSSNFLPETQKWKTPRVFQEMLKTLAVSHNQSLQPYERGASAVNSTDSCQPRIMILDCLIVVIHQSFVTTASPLGMGGL